MDAQYNPRTVEEVFRDFKGRRAGLVRALTADVEDFFRQCDPGEWNFFFPLLFFFSCLSLSMRVGICTGNAFVSSTNALSSLRIYALQ
jgi:hypothetical protein